MEPNEPTAKCEDRIFHHLTARVGEVRHLTGPTHKAEGCRCDLEGLSDFGLSFDYVSAGTFEGQAEGYFRWQLSTGGPGDEFRFYADAAGSLHRVEYWFLDWYDGAHRVLAGSDYSTLACVFDEFRELGAVEKALVGAEP